VILAGIQANEVVVEGAMSSLSIAVSGILTVLGAIIFAHII
jgi:putative effector of murein hydrolase